MFRHFTPEARDVVVRAQHDAIALRHNYLGKEHLFLAVVESTGVGAEVLRDLGVKRDDVVREIVRIVGLGPPAQLGSRDADALRSIGIDLDEVRRSVEDTFGPGALEAGQNGCGGTRFTPKTKQALELALRESKALGDAEIRTEHILLGLIRSPGGAGAEVISALGLDPNTVRARVLEKLARAS